MTDKHPGYCLNCNADRYMTLKLAGYIGCIICGTREPTPAELADYWRRECATWHGIALDGADEIASLSRQIEEGIPNRI